MRLPPTGQHSTVTAETDLVYHLPQIRRNKCKTSTFSRIPPIKQSNQNRPLNGDNKQRHSSLPPNFVICPSQPLSHNHDASIPLLLPPAIANGNRKPVSKSAPLPSVVATPCQKSNSERQRNRNIITPPQGDILRSGSNSNCSVVSGSLGCVELSTGCGPWFAVDEDEKSRSHNCDDFLNQSSNDIYYFPAIHRRPFPVTNPSVAPPLIGRRKRKLRELRHSNVGHKPKRKRRRVEPTLLQPYESTIAPLIIDNHCIETQSTQPKSKSKSLSVTTPRRRRIAPQLIGDVSPESVSAIERFHASFDPSNSSDLSSENAPPTLSENENVFQYHTGNGASGFFADAIVQTQSLSSSSDCGYPDDSGNSMPIQICTDGNSEVKLGSDAESGKNSVQSISSAPDERISLRYRRKSITVVEERSRSEWHISRKEKDLTQSSNKSRSISTQTSPLQSDNDKQHVTVRKITDYFQPIHK